MTSQRKTESVADNSYNIKFIADLGRNLLSAVHPRKVALCTASELRKTLNATVAAVVVKHKRIGLLSCAFNSDGQEIADFLIKTRFENWVEILPPKISYLNKNKDKFFLKNVSHSFEYISPLQIDGKVRGAVIVGFRGKNNCSDETRQLIDAAAQVAALSLNFTTHYEAALDNSMNEEREQNRKFTGSVLDALPVSIYVIDRDYKIVMWNHHREIGKDGIPRESAIGRNLFEVLAKPSKSKLSREFERVFETGNIERIEESSTDANGATKHWSVRKIPLRGSKTGKVTHVITVGEDVTMRVEALQAIGRAEKLSAVGRLAAGVVHEINNPLTTISVCAEALGERIKDSAFTDSEDVENLKEYLELINSEAFRCKSITANLLDFSRARTPQRAEVSLKKIVDSAVNLLKHQKRGASVKIKVDVSTSLPPIYADAGQIQQVLIALAENAFDAMPDGGVLAFRAVQKGKKIIIKIEDTGSGIAPEDLSKIFEPFFTTKEVGEGTGLGLSICYGIIRENRGKLEVQSKLGKGTTFTIHLPVKL